MKYNLNHIDLFTAFAVMITEEVNYGKADLTAYINIVDTLNKHDVPLTDRKENYFEPIKQYAIAIMEIRSSMLRPEYKDEVINSLIHTFIEKYCED